MMAMNHLILTFGGLLMTVWGSFLIAQQIPGELPPELGTNPEFYGENIFERDLFGRAQPRVPSGAARPNGSHVAMQNQNLLLRALDLDGDLQLSIEELQRATKSLLALDADKDGVLSPDEIQPGLSRRLAAKITADKIRQRALQQAQRPSPKQQFIQQMVGSFLKFDKNDDGEISETELPKHLRSFMEKADVNSDGSLSYDELNLAAEKSWSTG